METCLGDRELLMHEMESLGNHGEELLQDLGASLVVSAD